MTKEKTNSSDKGWKKVIEFRVREETARKNKVTGRKEIVGCFAATIGLGLIYLGLNAFGKYLSEPSPLAKPDRNKYMHQNGWAYQLREGVQTINLILVDEDSISGVEKIIRREKTESGAVIYPVIAEIPTPELRRLYPGIIADSTTIAWANAITEYQRKLAFRIDSIEYEKDSVFRNERKGK